jgi:hypothetical protein
MRENYVKFVTGETMKLPKRAGDRISWICERRYINNQAAMKAPGYIAIFVSLLLAFTLLQGMAWPVRPESGWQQSWWQSHTWANVGHLLSLPAMIPAVILENCGIFHSSILLSATVFGFLVEIAFVSVVVYFLPADGSSCTLTIELAEPVAGNKYPGC